MFPPSPHSPTWRINSSMQWNGSTESISNFPLRNPSRPSCRIQPEICCGWHQCLAAGCHYADPLCMRLGICVFTSSCLDPLSERKLSSYSCRRNLLLFPVLLNERGWPIWYNCCWTSSRKPYWELIFCIGEDIIFGPPVLASHWVQTVSVGLSLLCNVPELGEHEKSGWRVGRRKAKPREPFLVCRAFHEVTLKWAGRPWF